VDGKLRFLRALVRLAPQAVRMSCCLCNAAQNLFVLRLLPSFVLLCRLLEEVSKNVKCKGMIFDT